jgi:hypothetical protein
MELDVQKRRMTLQKTLRSSWCSTLTPYRTLEHARLVCLTRTSAYLPAKSTSLPQPKSPISSMLRSGLIRAFSSMSKVPGKPLVVIVGATGTGKSDVSHAETCHYIRPNHTRGVARCRPSPSLQWRNHQWRCYAAISGVTYHYQ